MGDQERKTKPESDAGQTLCAAGNCRNPRKQKAAEPMGKSLRHELRTPLNQIIGYSEMLQEDAQDRGLDEFAEDLKKIERAGRRMLGLVDQLTSGLATTSPGPLEERRPSIVDDESTVLPVVAQPPNAKDLILVVDDNEANRDILARRLKARGYQVETAADGYEALAAVERRAFDLVLLDVMMPELNGLDVLQILRATRSVSELPVVMATALDASEDVVKALRLGANDYVTKPLDFAVVLARIATQLSLKHARDEVQSLNRRLQEAQQRIIRLADSASEAIRDVESWSAAIAREVARAVGARGIAVFVFDQDQPAALTHTLVRAPNIDEVIAVARTGRFLDRDAETIVPVIGMSGEVYGALVVESPSCELGETEMRLVGSFARQLGGALELRRMQQELTEAEERKRASRQDMLARGIDLLRICPSCRTCYDQNVSSCPHDGASLRDAGAMPFRVGGRHRLERVLGEGGMGTVFAAFDERLERHVAVKVIKSEHFNNDTVRIRFENEARAVARIDHPGVVAVYDSGEFEDGSLFIVMELLSGRDLAELCRVCGRGTPAQVAALLRQGAAALAAAHSVRLVHRDIKPENIFLVAEPRGFRAKILDFGVAKQISCDTALTQTGTLIGTPMFMSPEQILGKQADYRSDVYSFAAVGYLALTGRRVTLGETLPEILLDVVQQEPPLVSSLVPGVPAVVDEAFTKALAKAPEARPDRIEEWVESFADALADVPSDTSGWVTGEKLLALSDSETGANPTLPFRRDLL